MRLENKFTIVNNIKIHYLIGGSGQTVILLGGWASSAQFYRKTGELLAEKFQVLIIDLPGFGRSGRLPKKWQFEDFKKIIFSFISQLKLNNIVLVGHSLGGAIAISVAVEFPQILSNLVLVNSIGIKTTFFIKTLRRQFRMREFIKLIPNFLLNVKDTKYILKIIQRLDLGEIINQVKVPTIFFWGMNDSYFKGDYYLKLFNKFNGARLVKVDQAEHDWLVIEPSRFFNYINYNVKSN